MSERLMHFICDEASAGLRLDVFLSEQAGLTRSAAQKLIQAGNVTVGGEPVPKNYKLRLNDTVEMEQKEAQPMEAEPEEMPLDILYEDSECIVVNKPQGLVVHPAPGHSGGTLVNALLHHARGQLSAINGVIRPGIVHRIDKDTSGVLVIAKTNEAHLFLAQQIKEHSVVREYICLAYGRFKETDFTVDKPLSRHPKDRKKIAVSANGRRAVTHVTVLRQYSDCALLRCRLETGRTHQIRVHLSSIGHPVVGDPIYGVHHDRLAKQFSLSGQMLHAQTLGFLHPKTGEKLCFSAPLPLYFQQVVDVLEKQNG